MTVNELTSFLVDYYNECMWVGEMLENEDVSEAEAEELLISLDYLHAKRILAACDNEKN